MTYSPDGHLLAIARTGNINYLPLSEPSAHRVTLYNAFDNYRYLKSDNEQHEPSEHKITCLAFAHVDLDAGDPSSWGGMAKNMLTQTTGQPEDEARRKAEEKNLEALIRAQMRAGTLKRTVYLTVLAYGDAAGNVRLWDYVQNQQEILPCPLPQVDRVGVKAITFTSDCRVMAVLYQPGNVVLWSFSRRRPTPLIVHKRKEIKSAKDALEWRAKEQNQPKIEVDVYEPRLPALGHPNRFFTAASPFIFECERSVNDIIAIPGFGPPTDSKGEEETDKEKKALDARARLELALPPPFPGANLTLREAAELVKWLTEGYTFTGFFLVSATDLTPVPKLNAHEKSQIKKINIQYARKQARKLKIKEKTSDDEEEEVEDDEDIEDTEDEDEDEDLSDTDEEDAEKDEDEEERTRRDSEVTMADTTAGDTTMGDGTQPDTTLGDTTLGDSTQGDAQTEHATTRRSKKKVNLQKKYPDLPKRARTGPKVVGGVEVPYLPLKGYGPKSKDKASYLAENQGDAAPANNDDAESEDSEDSIILGEDEELKAHYENIIKARATALYNEEVRAKALKERRNKRRKGGNTEAEEAEEARRAANQQIVIPVPVRIEYIPPLPYPKNALLMAHNHNVERYHDMYQRKQEFLRLEASERKRKIEEAQQQGIPYTGGMPEDVDPEDFDDLDFVEPEPAGENGRDDDESRRRINEASTTLDLTKIYTRNPDPLTVMLNNEYEKSVVVASKRLPVAAVTLPPLPRAKLEEEQDEYLREAGLVHLTEGSPRTYELVGDLLIRDQVREYNFPLYDLKQIQIGKLSVELGSSAASRYPDKCCFSLIGSKDQLHLVADTQEDVEKWITALRFILWRVGRYLAPSKRSPSLYSDRIPPPKFLDVDMLATIAGFDPNEKLSTTLLAKSKTKERGETYQDSSPDSIEGVFTTPCHTYRIMYAADYVNMIMEVRVDHDKVFERYANKGDAPTLKMRTDLRPKNENKEAGEEDEGESLQALEEKILAAQKPTENEKIVGEWGFITVMRTSFITSKLASFRNGKFIIAAERISSTFRPEWIALHLEDHIPFQEMARALVKSEQQKHGKLTMQQLYPNAGTFTVSVWSVKDGNMVRYPIGMHDSVVSGVAALPPTFLQESGSKYTLDDEGYILCSASLDETMRLWTYAATELDVSRTTWLRPLQIVMRPLPLRQLTPDNAQQGRGPEHVMDQLHSLTGESSPQSAANSQDTPPTLTLAQTPEPTTELTPAQRLQEEAKERARRENLQQRTREYVLKSTVISTRKKPVAPGPKLKQLNALLYLKERQYEEAEDGSRSSDD